MAVAGLGLGVTISAAVLLDLGRSHQPVANAVRGAVSQATAPVRAGLGRSGGVAEVEVVFDGRGRVSGRALRRSSGSAAADAWALGAALDLATLHRREEVAGRTLLIRTRFCAAGGSCDREVAAAAG